jgi:prepilin-type N-terminal cleavage/methylation domain-containing protein
MKSSYFLRNQKGFTLIELLSVMIIMDVMSSVAVQKFDTLSDTASKQALAWALKELNTRESLIWTNIKLSYDGWTYDSAVFSAVDTDLGPQYNWRPKPKITGGRLHLKSQKRWQ